MRRAKNHGPLTCEQLRHIGEHAMSDGAELSSESRLLLDSGHHARAFGLSVLAVEEAGKAFMCAVWARAEAHSDRSFGVAGVLGSLHEPRSEIRVGRRELA
jgi:hypothetical protein